MHCSEEAGAAALSPSLARREDEVERETHGREGSEKKTPFSRASCSRRTGRKAPVYFYKLVVLLPSEIEIKGDMVGWRV